MRRLRQAVTGILIGGLFALGGDWPGAVVGAEERAGYAAACNTYDNRARFRPRTPPVEFVVMMAEGCRAALLSLETGSPLERRRAAAYLARLEAFRDVVVQIALDRTYGAGADPFSRPKEAGARIRPLGAVSETGEFLIAHRMGLLAAFRSWASEAGEPAFAQGSVPKG